MTLLYLQNHYDVEEIDLGYQFVTQIRVTYFLTFISYPTVSDFLSTKIYMFNIFSANHYNKAFLEQEFLKLVEINFYS